MTTQGKIVMEMPLEKHTRVRIKYSNTEWDTALVTGQVYPRKEAVQEAFGKVPTKIRITIEEVV